MRLGARIQFNHTKQIKGELKDNASKLIRKTLLDVLADAASLAPVDTGALKNSLTPGGEGNVFDMQPGDLFGVAGTSIEYSGYVEYGTRRMAAQPYLTPAAERHRPVFEAGMAHLLKGA